MKLHLPKLLLTAVLAALVSFQAHATNYMITEDATSYTLSGDDRLLYHNADADGRVISNAEISANTGDKNVWVGPSSGANSSATQATKPVFVQLNGAITGSGTIQFNEYPASGSNAFVIYELTDSSSTFSGTIKLANGQGNNQDAQLNLNDTSEAYKNTEIQEAGEDTVANYILNIGSNVSVAGLSNKLTVTSTDANNVLTLAGTGNYSSSGTLGSASYHTHSYTEGTDTVFDTATSAAINIVKSGDGTQTFTGAANLGTVTVSDGILNLNGTTTTSGAVSVTGGKLNLNGTTTLNGAVSVTGGTLGVGNTLTLSSTVTGTGEVTNSGTIILAQDQLNHFGCSSYSGTGDYAGSGYATGDLTVFGSDINYSGSGTVNVNGTSYTVNNGVISLGTDATNWNSYYYINSNLAYNTNEMSSAGALVVTDGKTLDVNGNAIGGHDVILQAGAKLTNSSLTDPEYSNAQIGTLTLTGDATVSGSGNFGIVKTNHAQSSITLNGHTLTKTGGNTFYVVNLASISGPGTIDVKEGIFKIAEYIGTTTNASEVVFNTSGGTLSLHYANTNLQAKAITGASGTITSTTGSTLTVSPGAGETYEYGGTISGDLKLVKNGEGTQILSGNNTFTGGTTINGGTLKLGHQNALGNGNYDIIVNGGTLDINGQMLTYDNSAVDGGSQYQGRTVTLGEGATLTNTGNAVGGESAQISHLILTGNATISGSKNATHGLVNGSYGNTTIAMDGHTLTKTGGNTFLLYNTTITGGGTVQVDEGTLQIAGDDSAGTTATDTVFATNGGTINIKDKTLAVKGISGSSGVITGAENGAKLTLTSDDDHSYSGVISGTLALEKNGTGTQTLRGENTYTGGTTINAGTLKLGNKSALGEGKVTVNNGATLDANGTGDVTNEVILKDGATLQNTTGGGITCGTLQFPKITLESAEGTVGNVTVNAENQFGMLGSEHGQTNLNLNGNTLTKRGGALFFLSNTVASAGTLKVLEGTLAAGISGSSTGTNTLDLSAVSVEVGQMNADNKGTFKLGQLPDNSGEYNLEKSIKSLKFDGGKVEVTGEGVLTVTNGTTVTAKGGEITGSGSANLGTLTLEAGATLSAEGSLTLGTLALDLSGYTAGEYKLVSSTGTLNWTEGSYTTTNLRSDLLANVSMADNCLSLTISPKSTEPTTTTLNIISVGTYNPTTEMLTLNVDDEVSDSGMYIIPGIADVFMQAILKETAGDADGMVCITLQGLNNTSVVAGINKNVGFQGKDGTSVYWGSQVDGKWQYQAQYIPEPATATLSLLALAGLAARRRRK